MKKGRTYVIALIVHLVAQAATIGIASAQSGRIFRCEVNGKAVYSDIACAGAAEKAEVDTELRNISSTPAPPGDDSFLERQQVSRSNTKSTRKSSNPTFVRAPLGSANSPFGAANPNTKPVEKRTNYSLKPAPGQAAIEKSGNYRADPPAEGGWNSGSNEVSIADSLAKHKEQCKKVDTQLYEANHTATETRFQGIDGSVHVVEHGKDKAKISKLEQELKRHKCR